MSEDDFGEELLGAIDNALGELSAKDTKKTFEELLAKAKEVQGEGEFSSLEEEFGLAKKPQTPPVSTHPVVVLKSQKSQTSVLRKKALEALRSSTGLSEVDKLIKMQAAVAYLTEAITLQKQKIEEGK